MKWNQKFGAIVIALAIIFIVEYLVEGIVDMNSNTLWLLGYKPLSLFILKLLYSLIMILGGLYTYINKKNGWYLLYFSSIGTLVSTCYCLISGYVFNNPVLDAIFLMEALSIIVIITLN